MPIPFKIICRCQVPETGGGHGRIASPLDPSVDRREYRPDLSINNSFKLLYCCIFYLCNSKTLRMKADNCNCATETVDHRKIWLGSEPKFRRICTNQFCHSSRIGLEWVERQIVALGDHSQMLLTSRNFGDIEISVPCTLILFIMPPPPGGGIKR